ncbi:MAG: TSUP family transporter, partial [Planctomycetia bacterium]
VLGGAMSLPTAALEATLGAFLLAAAIRILAEAGPSSIRGAGRAEEPSDTACREAPWAVLAALGGGIGLMSGLTGVGGGVFLTPALLALRAAPVRQVAAVTAPFILVNSLAGLAGGLVAGRPPPAATAPVLVAAAVGGTVGASLGAFRLPASALRLVMAAVLAFAAAKLLARPLGW